MNQRQVAAEPLAFLSDIHGNADALRAVLRELDVLRVEHVFVAGDLLLGGPAPLEVWQLLTQRNATCVRGLSDTALCKIAPSDLLPTSEDEHKKSREFQATLSSIGDLVLERLRRLPERLRLPLIDGRELLMVHGSPADYQQEMTVDLSDEELMSLVADDPADIIVCGASHVPFHRHVSEIDVVNVGSVGAAPEGRIAHYTIITPRMNGAIIDQRWLEY